MDISEQTKELPESDAPGKESWIVARGLVPAAGPKRVLALATFVNMVGNGLFMTGAALFFTRSVGLSVAKVGLGMGIAALVGLLAGVPIGHLADRRGPREIYLVTLTLQAVTVAALVLVHTFWLFVAVVCLTNLSSSASSAARGPLIRAVGAPNATKYRSYLRALNNLAGSLGAIAAAVAVQLDTRAAYVALVLGNAVTFIACAAVITQLPTLTPVVAPPTSGRWIALKDKPYVALTVLDGIMSIQGQVLVFALPLWIVGHTHAPRWFVGVSVLVNTLMVVCLQVRASRGVDSNAAAGRVVRRSGLAFLAGMALVSFTGGMPGYLGAAVIMIGVAVHTIGELWHAAASFELTFGLAPSHAQGQYTGLYGIGQGLSSAVAPSVLGLFCISWGTPGWLALGGVFVLVGLAIPYVVRWYEKGQSTIAHDAA